MRTNFEQSYEKLAPGDDLGDKLLSKCSAVVLSRKFVLGILVVSIVLLFFLLGSVNLRGIELQNTTWQEYIADCGGNARLDNQDLAKKNFETKYAKNIVNWEGVFEKKYSRNGPVGGLYVKMNPSDAKPQMADIHLTISPSLASENLALFNQLTEGDVLKFKARFIQMGDESHYHHLEAINITSANRKVDIDTIPTVNNSVKPAPLKKGPESTNINFIPS